MNRNFSGNDRRRFQRLRMNLTVVYRVNQPLTVRMLIGDEEIEATTLDLSEGGMALLTKFDIPRGTSLFIKFTLFKVDKAGKVNFYGPMLISGEVRSNVISENDEHRLGICFVNMDEQDRQEMNSFFKMTKNV